MNKRRLEVLLLAALVVLAAADRPGASANLPRVTYRIADLAPQHVDGVRDLGVIAVKLAIDWID